MATKVLLPKFGQTVETSEIVSWAVAEGATVRKGAILCEIATDKSTLEVESQYEGTLLKILLPVGTTAPVGCVMALIGTAGETVPDSLVQECLATHAAAPINATAPEAAAPAPILVAAPVVAPVPAPQPAVKATPAAKPAPRPMQRDRIFVSPRAKALASDRQVPLEILVGSGDEGRIVEADVRAYLDITSNATPAARAAAMAKTIDLRPIVGSGGAGRITIEDLLQAQLSHSMQGGKVAKKQPKSAGAPLIARVEKPTPMRKAIAANMVASTSAIPAFQLEISVDAAALIARRSTDKAAGVNISYGDYLASAVGQAIRRFPLFAAAWTDAGIAFRDGVHIGFAVAVPGGLVVPVVHHCDQRSPADIAAQSAALVAKARANQLAPADYQGAVFTLSNLGSFPVDRFTAIVPPGQSGIIAVGRIRDEVVIKNGGIHAAKLMSLTLSADHRIIDGAEGAAFMADVKDFLEGM